MAVMYIPMLTLPRIFRIVHPRRKPFFATCLLHVQPRSHLPTRAGYLIGPISGLLHWLQHHIIWDSLSLAVFGWSDRMAPYSGYYLDIRRPLMFWYRRAYRPKMIPNNTVLVIMFGSIPV